MMTTTTNTKPARIWNTDVQVPDWANWLAQDEDGFWYAFALKPFSALTCWLHQMEDRAPHKVLDLEVKPNPNWKKTLIAL